MAFRKPNEGNIGDILINQIKKIERLSTKNEPAFKNITNYHRIADDFMKRHTHGVFLLQENDMRTLIVYADSSTSAQELNMNSCLYMARIEMIFGDTWIDKIQFRVNKRTYKKKQREKSEDLSPAYIDSETQRKSLSSKELLEIEKTVSKISDEKLREIAKKALISDVEWKKGKKS